MEPRIFHVADAKKCFPQIGNQTVQFWRDQNLLSCGQEQRGQLQYTTFNWPELVHLGVVTHLSALGVFKAQSEVELIVTDFEETPDLTLDFKRPQEIIAFYEQFNYRVAVTLQTSTSNRKGARERYPRTATANLNFDVAITPHDRAKDLFENWYDMSGMFAGFMQNVSFVGVYAVACHVTRTLKIDAPILSQEPAQSKLREGRRGTIIINKGNHGNH